MTVRDYAKELLHGVFYFFDMEGNLICDSDDLFREGKNHNLFRYLLDLRIVDIWKDRFIIVSLVPYKETLSERISIRRSR